MDKVTIIAMESGDSIDREFHVDRSEASAFVARVVASGGSAQIAPFKMRKNLMYILNGVSGEVQS